MFVDRMGSSVRTLVTVLALALVGLVANDGARLSASAQTPEQHLPPLIRKLGGLEPYAFGQPTGIAVDRGGNIYVADYELRRVQRFGPQGNFLLQFPVSIGPTDVSIGPDGLVYVVGGGGSDGDIGRVVKFTSEGVLLNSWRVANLRGDESPGLAVAVDPQGFVYVGDASDPARILKFTSEGVLVKQFGNGDRYRRYVGLATDGTYLYTVKAGPPGSDSLHKVFQKFDFEGLLLAEWGDFNQLSTATGIALEGNGNVLISEAAGHRILTFSQDGRLLGQLGSRGQGNGQFDMPSKLVSDGQGNLYISDA